MSQDFDGLLDGVLREMAEVEVKEGFAMRMMTAYESDVVVGIGPGVQTNPFGSSFGLLVRKERGFGPFGWAMLAHAAVLLVVGFGWAAKRQVLSVKEAQVMARLEVPPMKAPPKAVTMGGGGGQAGATPVVQGRLPKFATEQMMPPKIAVEQAKLTVEPTVVMQKDLKMANNEMPNLGMPNSPVVGVGSLGNGSGSGIGGGNGAGVGVGSGGNTGGGAMKVGGGVSAPVPVFMPDPEFSEEARKAKVSGNVLVYLWVDQNGRATNARVVRGIGMGLDEKALAAVRQYRFKPAMKDGKPVTVEMNVDVTFAIF